MHPRLPVRVEEDGHVGAEGDVSHPLHRARRPGGGHAGQAGEDIPAGGLPPGDGGLALGQLAIVAAAGAPEEV